MLHLVAPLALTLLAGTAASRPAACYLSIDGAVVIDGRCDFETFGGDGSFQITTPDGRWFAVVSILEPGVADGWWNASAFAGRAHSPLGRLVRNEACWGNDRVSVCAW